MMSDLIDGYRRKGLISDPTRNFVCCDVCGYDYHPDDITEVDELTCSEEHVTLEVCRYCCAKKKARDDD